jgi:hypothetical protein
MDDIGHIRLPTEEDASYVHFDADDLVVISGIDDDLPEDNPANLSDLVDDDVLDSEHLLRRISASPGLAPWGFPFPSSRRLHRGPHIARPRRSRGSKKNQRGKRKSGTRTRTRRRVRFQVPSDSTDPSSVNLGVDSVDPDSLNSVERSSVPSADTLPDDVADLLDDADDFDVSALEHRLHELHALDPLLRETKQSRSAFYADFYRRDSEDSCTKGRAHVDGGAQTSTTGEKDLLWHYVEFPSTQKVPTLRVADETPHYPIGYGYLKVPSLTGSGHHLVACFHTPTLPATLVSPDRIGKAFKCEGYSTLSLFKRTQQCELRLHHCQRDSQDLLFPLTSIRGLLFTDLLVKPTAAEHVAPRPRATIHVCSLAVKSVPASPGNAPSDDIPSVNLDATAPTTDPDSSSDGVDGLTEADDLHDCGLESSPTVCACQSGSPPPISGIGEGTYCMPTTPSSSEPVPRTATDSSSCNCQPRSCSCSPIPDLVPTLADSVPDDRVIHALTRQQHWVLWHHRLGHLHSRRMNTLQKHVLGLPELPIADAELCPCPICAQEKLTKHARGKADSRRATECNQGISIDVGFIVQTSKDSERLQRLLGHNGESCYVLITDHKSGTLYGQTLCSKAPPIDFINRWLAKHGCSKDTPDKYVRMDLGGELGRCREIRSLFEEAGYAVEPTAADSSHQSGPGERPHRTIKDALRTILAGAALDPKFWPYAFHHYLRLYNLTSHGDRSQSCFEICTGQLPNLKPLRTFGCRVYALPARAHRPASLIHDARIGIFLGFTKTFKNIFYFDLSTGKVKEAQHVAFDEGFSGVADADAPPHARILRAAGLVPHGSPTSDDRLDLDIADINLEVDANPFLSIDELHVPFKPTADHPLGLTFNRCGKLLRAYVSGIHSPAERFNLRTFRRKFLGSYVVSIDDTPVFSLADTHAVLDRLQSLETPPKSIRIVLAPERKELASDSRSPPLHLQLSSLRHIAALNAVPGEGFAKASAYSAALTAKAASYSDSHVAAAVHRVDGPTLASSDDLDPALASLIPLDDDPTPLSLHRLQTSHMTEEERALSRLTRRNLLKLSNWTTWDESFDSQLDAQAKCGALGEPIPRPPHPAHVLRAQWVCAVKDDGQRKARICLDGSKRSAPWLRELASTYASCIETPCMRLFYALAAAESMIVTTADSTNAYQHSPPPSTACFLEIDDAYASWYSKRHGKVLDRKALVVPVLKALQGHPEAGRLWEGMIVGILETQLGFSSTVHERNLYRGLVDGQTVLVCRQVDDFAIASHDPATAEKLVSLINVHVPTIHQGIGTDRPSGVHSRYNGLDVHQTAEFIKLNCETYIDRVLQTHGWTSPAADESDRHDSVPMTPDSGTRMVTVEPGPAEGTIDHKRLEQSIGYSFRQILGELTYAYVLCRPDIGYAVTLLSRFSTAPHREHYLALKQICRYLRRTRDWGILYWRTKPVSSLPTVLIDPVVLDPALGCFPPSSLTALVGHVDAAHGTDLKTRRSVTGYVFTLAGGAIAYKSKLQSICATSSTEAEFLAAVHAAKTAKYLRWVLFELGYKQDGPTVLHVDNMAAVAMINENKPTPRSRHIDIQHFAIQEWRERGEIVVSHLAGSLNPADQATKALGSQLHARHARRAMGHFGPPNLPCPSG